jgi:hypothetical protein
MRLRKTFVLCMIVLLVTGSATVSWSRQPEGARVEDIVDLLVLRPVGIIATLAGTGVFVVTLPFTIPTKTVDKSADRFVVTPFNYTFSRPFPDKNL